MLLTEPDYMTNLLSYLQHPDLEEAEKAFGVLKKYWPWEREYTFLIPNLDNNTEEPNFILALGLDIMKIVEMDHITRVDYIIEHTNKQSLETITNRIKGYISLQINGDRNGLLNEINRLRNRVIKNGRKTIVIDNICLAAVEKIYLDPITTLLHKIKYAPLEEAEAAYRTLENIDQSQKYKGNDLTAYCSLLSDHIKESLSAFLISRQKNFSSI